MQTHVQYKNANYVANLTAPIDISIPIQVNGVRAWGVSDFSINPVKKGGWIGDVALGSEVNFNNILFNPHAHTTHTECVGHISNEKESINMELSKFFFIAKLITVSPQKQRGDSVITKEIIASKIDETDNVDALIIRTLPNPVNKISKNYSNTNPTYISKEAATYMSKIKINHLLIDLPSVDKEKDGGALSAHKSFWRFPNQTRHGCTITELIYVPNNAPDDIYLLNLQFAPFENDASPSRPLLFKLRKESQ